MTASLHSPSRPLRRALAAAVLAAVALGGSARAQDLEPSPAPEERQGKLIYSVPIEGPLNPTMIHLFRRIRDDARTAGAEVLVVEIDTPGGEVNLMMELADLIYSTDDFRTVAWITGNAWSAGALIALACDEIYMRETATIGASQVVAMGGPQPDEDYQEKMTSAFRGKFIAYAQNRGRPVALAEAMVDNSTVVHRVEIGGESYFMKPHELAQRRQNAPNGQIQDRGIIVEEGKLLTLSAKDAVTYGFADGLANTREELQDKWLLLSDADWVVGKKTWSEEVAWTLNAFKILLILAGCVLLYVEFKAPGFGLPGILGLICFGLLLSANYIAGLASIGEMLLVFLGLALIAVEIFVIPGFGLAGLSGIVLLVLGLILSLQTFAIPATAFEEQLLFENLLSLVVSLALFLVIAPMVSRFLPKVPLFRGIMLQPPATASAGGGGAPLTAGAEGVSGPEPGDQGEAVTDLYPSGKMRAGGRVYDVMAQGQYIERGAPVRVVQVRGNRILVRSVETSSSPDRA